MENIDIVINKKTRMIDSMSKHFLGIEGENLQENLIFTFNDSFVDGQARLEVQFPDKTKSWITLTKIGETYQMPVKSIMTKNGKISMELVITEGIDENEIPIFKSKIFYLVVDSALNAVEEAPPSGYESWLEIANAKINEINALMADMLQKVQSGYFNGKDAVINGYNTLNIVAGEHVIIEQDENTLIISAEGVAPYPDNVLMTSDDNIFMTSDDAYFVVKESE